MFCYNRLCVFSFCLFLCVQFGERNELLLQNFVKFIKLCLCKVLLLSFHCIYCSQMFGRHLIPLSRCRFQLELQFFPSSLFCVKLALHKFDLLFERAHKCIGGSCTFFCSLPRFLMYLTELDSRVRSRLRQHKLLLPIPDTSLGCFFSGSSQLLLRYCSATELRKGANIDSKLFHRRRKVGFNCLLGACYF